METLCGFRDRNFPLDKSVSVTETARMNALRKYRDAEAITLDELGRRLGVTKSTAWKWERRPILAAELVLKIEREIGIPRDELRPDLWPNGPLADEGGVSE